MSQTLSSPPPSLANAACRVAGLTGRVLWMDATANLASLNSREKVAAALDRAVRAHFNCVVVDVKPIVGEVLYPSDVAPRLLQWQGASTPPDHDLLRAAVEEGRKRGLRVHASVNVFAEGHKLVSRGPAYDRPEWQCLAYEPLREVVAPDGFRRAITGQNAPPGPDELVVYLRSSGPDRKPLEGEVAATYSGDRVTALVDAASVEGTLPIPPRPGGMLVGRGSAASWLLEHLAPGQPLDFSLTTRLARVQEATTDRYAVFVNPLHPEARRHELELIREIAERYEVDGILFDRMRFPGLHADFSDLSRAAFERRLGRRVERWPEDVLEWPVQPGGEVLRGPVFEEWLEFRAAVIHDFLEEAAAAVRKARPGAKVGVYVGSWYEAYFDVGVNWGSPSFRPGYDWMSEGYPATGYADQLDLLCSGTYYPIAWKQDAPQSPGQTVEGSSELSIRATADQTITYGSLYVVQYAGKPQAFQEAIRAALAATQGVMIFDMSHVDQYGWWPVLEEALRPYSGPPPHADSELLARVRAAREAADRLRRQADAAPTEIPVSTEHPDL